ncbi:hypothetical protein DSUL_20006 [Desulfovibrionales bacterium]
MGAYYLEEVRRWLIEAMSEANQYKQHINLGRSGEDAVYNAGLHVWTDCDLDHQDAAKKALKDGLWEHARRTSRQGPIMNLPKKQWETFLSQPSQRLTLGSGSWAKALVSEVTKHEATIHYGKPHWHHRSRSGGLAQGTKK